APLSRHRDGLPPVGSAPRVAAGPEARRADLSSECAVVVMPSPCPPLTVFCSVLLRGNPGLLSRSTRNRAGVRALRPVLPTLGMIDDECQSSVPPLAWFGTLQPTAQEPRDLPSGDGLQLPFNEILHNENQVPCLV